MKITILGTGTSRGIPEIGCDCAVCKSANPRDKRLRVSVLIETAEQCLVIDAGPDFRQQLLTSQVHKLDAILLTHEHNDHIIGIDDLRPLIFRQNQPMPIHCSAQVADELKIRFGYAFAENPYPGAPQLDLQLIDKNSRLQFGNLHITPIAYLHATLPVLGYRIGDFAYLTDIKTISEDELHKVVGVDTLIISALHHREHHSHLSLREALALIERIGPRRAYLTHLSHEMGLHAEVNASLPAGVELAYDGLELLF